MEGIVTLIRIFKDEGPEMKKNDILKTIATVLTCMLLSSGCGLSKPADAVSDASEPTEPVQATEVLADDTADEPAISDESASPMGKHVTEGADASTSSELSLAKRLCGKYSYKDSNGEYQILEICEFADNLYAYYGFSMEEEEGVEPDELYAYSFYCLELIPDNASDVRSETADSVDVNILAFSIMSNLTKYQAAPEKCNIELEEGGIEVTSAYFTGKNETVFFEADDRVEDAFPYMKDADAGKGINDDFFTGLWRETGSDNPYYLDFKENGVIKIYQEEPGTEVTFGGGSYSGPENDLLSFRCSFLGSGSMPYETQTWIYPNGNNEIELEFSSSDISDFEEKKDMFFEKIEEADVPIVTIDEVKKILTDDHVYDMYSQDASTSEVKMLDEFYGVWLSAFEESDDAVELVEKLEKDGFDAIYVYSPEWKNLSSKPYYCVTAGICDTQADADSLLAKVKDAGYKDAYVKSTGARLEQRIYYNIYDESSSYEFKNDRVIVNAGEVSGVGYEELPEMRLVVDSETEFASACKTEFFGNYEEGDTPLEWFIRNKNFLDTDYDEYSKHGPALKGVFEVSITGDHIDKFYGSYWWD